MSSNQKCAHSLFNSTEFPLTSIPKLYDNTITTSSTTNCVAYNNDYLLSTGSTQTPTVMSLNTPSNTQYVTNLNINTSKMTTLYCDDTKDIIPAYTINYTGTQIDNDKVTSTSSISYICPVGGWCMNPNNMATFAVNNKNVTFNSPSNTYNIATTLDSKPVSILDSDNNDVNINTLCISKL